MCFEPILFTNSMYETANEAVLFCKTYLEEEGLDDLAGCLAGLDAVNEAAIGRVAHRVLLGMQSRVPSAHGECIATALNALERALGMSSLQVAV